MNFICTKKSNVNGFFPVQNVGLNSDYMRIQTDLPEVDVPKGTIVRVDPDCHLGSLENGLHLSVTVISVDHFENQENPFDNVKLTVITKVSNIYT